MPATVLSSYTSGDPLVDDSLEYNITIIFEDNPSFPWTTETQQPFIDAADLLSTIITGDVEDFDGLVLFPDVGLVNVTAEDIELTVSLEDIDGVSGTLGSAGPTVLRGGTDAPLPVTGVITIDSSDVGNLIAQGDLDGVVLHEMIHTLGVGTIWESAPLDLLVDLDPNTTDTITDFYYTGTNGVFEWENNPDFAAAYAAAVTAGTADNGVPVENDGGEGTAGGHWDEDVFGTELLTGFYNSFVENPLSNLTIAALEDLGYETTYVPTCFLAGARITTCDGSVRVEELQIGDWIRTADGRDVAVRWIGRQTVSALRHGAHMQPVRISAGALGAGLPDRDLDVTADHGMVIEDWVINASALVNGRTIDFVPLDELRDSFIVYHIETENHDVILANGAPSETFVDCATRQCFDNYDEYLALYGADRIIAEMPRPRLTSARMIPATLKNRLSPVGTNSIEHQKYIA
jgi:hypothetical protein